MLRRFGGPSPKGRAVYMGVAWATIMTVFSIVNGLVQDGTVRSRSLIIDLILWPFAAVVMGGWTYWWRARHPPDDGGMKELIARYEARNPQDESVSRSASLRRDASDAPG